jgi:hypothetical protein
VTHSFPPDLLDLLRLACRQGRMRLNTSFGAGRGHQANLANSGSGWTIDSDPDPLEAIAKVLRIRFGKALERQRTGDPDAADAIHSEHRDDQGGRYTGQPRQIDIEEAIAASHAGETSVEDLIG